MNLKQKTPASVLILWKTIDAKKIVGYIRIQNNEQLQRHALS
jgi:hypothetical protein